jgi:enamine deaminase RidA (YjgF/YER057c/UK114 family)
MTEVTQPIPQGHYIAAKRHHDLVFTAGMTPRQDGVLTVPGQVQVDEPPETYRAPVELALRNALNAVRGCLEPDEGIGAILHMQVFVNAPPGCTAQSKIADIASDLLYRELGTAGIGSRAALGVASLPGEAARFAINLV